MRLNSIYIKGFKSFYKETLINFNERVTGVVGPNGSGKSNIVDAIRWVLGEQKTKELRLDTMSDILFNGTEKRKKSPMAQVTLTFDNTKNLLPTEYNTVAISRVLYRSGESEYRINDVACRLKDIRSLFIDTGIGSDSYAIIALNMVEDILSDSNGSRRMMVEQAAGISKFKKRKRETLAKLKLTKVDLDRIEDLLFEIEGNLKDLEKQARKAERFIKIRDQYKDLNIKLQLLKYDKIVDSYREVKQSIDSELTVYRNLDSDIIKKEADLEGKKNNIIESEKNLSDFQRKINEHLDSLRKDENEKQLLTQKYQFDKNKVRDLEKAKIVIFEKLENLKKVIDSISKRIEEEKIKLDKFQKSFDESDANHSKIKKQYEEVKIHADKVNLLKKELEDEKFKIVKTQAILQNNIDNIETDNIRKKQKEKSLEEEIKSIKNNSININKEKELLEKEIQSFEKKKEEKTNILKKLFEEKELLIQSKNEISRKLDARRNEYRLVKGMIDKLEGFPESIKYLSKNWDKDIPLLTDIISTSDEYKVAIETFLEPYLNYFVVDNSMQARKAINILRKTQKGKAHFFILDKLEEIKISNSKLDNYIAAIDIVEYDDKYSNLIKILLENVFISIVEMDDIYTGKELDSIIIIDKSGSFISGKYKVSGGSLGLFEGKKIGRKKNLEKLNKLVLQYEKELNKINNELEIKNNKISQLKSLSNEKESKLLRGNFEKLKNQVFQSNFKLESKINNLKALKADIDSNLMAIKSKLESIKSNKKNLSVIEKKILDISENYKNKGDDIEVIMENLSKASALTNNAKIDLIRQQNLINTLKQDIDYKIADKNNNEKQLDANEKSYTELSRDLVEIEKRLNSLDLILEEKYKLKANYENDLGGIEKEYFENRNKVTEKESEISKLKHQLTKSQYLINQLKEKQLDLDFKKKAVNERLKIEFNLQLKDVLDFERIEEEEFTLEDKVGKLRNRLDNYGEVNTLAVEAYNEMKSRYENITKQREDILNAEKSLKKTITEIEKTATERFLSAFVDIREHFKNVFTTLFKEGDTCDLFLDDEDSPLDSKISIIAKPKGKRPKSLSQLSGGEKTLTAIALLFSLYLYKPAPFCIFDEVDAPLDDANIMKFNNIIRKFSENSQFIVVTHNKATMASVDVLYGVFMQELGISEVAQVDFRNYENLHTIAN